VPFRPHADLAKSRARQAPGKYSRIIEKSRRPGASPRFAGPGSPAPISSLEDSPAGIPLAIPDAVEPETPWIEESPGEICPESLPLPAAILPPVSKSPRPIRAGGASADVPLVRRSSPPRAPPQPSPPVRAAMIPHPDGSLAPRTCVDARLTLAGEAGSVVHSQTRRPCARRSGATLRQRAKPLSSPASRSSSKRPPILLGQG
jgi:hypothetical protein